MESATLTQRGKKNPSFGKKEALLRRIPCTTQTNMLCNRLCADFDVEDNARRAEQAAAQTVDFAALVASFKDNWAAISDLFNDALLSQSDGRLRDELLKQGNAAMRELAGRTIKRVSATTAAVRTVIWKVNNLLVRKHFERMIDNNPQLFEDYADGKQTVLTLTTSTEWLAKVALLKKGSFTGNREGAIYHSLKRLNFCEREHFDRQGNANSSAHEVTLHINVSEWFFGHTTAISLEADPIGETQADSFLRATTGNSMQIIPINTVEEQITKEKEASPSYSTPIGVTQQVEGDSTSTPLLNTDTDTVEFSAAPAAVPTPADVKIGQKMFEKAENSLFTPKNLADLRIRTNANTAITYIAPLSKQTCETRMSQIVALLRAQGMDAQDIVTAITEEIDNIQQELVTGKRAYLYAPEMWLRTDYRTATLWSAIGGDSTAPKVQKIAPSVQNHQSDTANAPEAALVAAAYDWLDTIGFHPRTRDVYARKHGVLPIAYAVQLMQFNLKAGFTPVNLTKYVNGVFKNLNPATVKAQLDLQLSAHAPKPGHIWEAWKRVVLANTQDPYIINAWERAKGVTLKDNTLVIEVKNDHHIDALECADSLALFRLAKQNTGINYRIVYANY